MTKRIIWTCGDLLNIKLRDDLYTIAQMLASPTMRFYDIRSSDGNWKNIDLNSIDHLFQVFVASRLINVHLAQGKIRDASVTPDRRPPEPLWLNPYTSMDGDHYKGTKDSFSFLGGKIIDIGIDGKIGTTLAPVVKEDLSLPEDRELIEKYELAWMWSHESLSDRLCRYFDAGINRDDLKFEVFPGLWNDREKLRPLTRRLPVPLR